jgi:predicted esterase
MRIPTTPAGICSTTFILASTFTSTIWGTRRFRISRLFLVHADDDKVVTPLDHSIRLYAAWKKLGIPAEMHIYSAGGHGFGTRKITLPAGTWTDRFRGWLDVQGLLKRPLT